MDPLTQLLGVLVPTLLVVALDALGRRRGS